MIYHDGYDLNLGPHVFPSQKYRMIHDGLLSDTIAEPDDFLVPQPAADEDVLRVHGERWVTRLRNGTLDYLELVKLEIPYSQKMVEAFWLAAGGSILAVQRALEDGICVNLGGGFHHAFPHHGEGFCAINDIAIAIRKTQADGRIGRVMVIDTDVHHGNGTAKIFADDPSVFTISIHQFDNYPSEKPPSNVDIHLENGAGDDEYLERLGRACAKALEEFRPQLILYVAGADPYREDQLGGLNLTMDGLKMRDELVFELARMHTTPVAVTLAGGYAVNVADTVTIHMNTVRAAQVIQLG